MPINLQKNGSLQEYDLLGKKNGSTIEYELYTKKNGSLVPIYKPDILIEDFEDSSPLSEWNIPSQTGTVTTSSESFHDATAMNLQNDGYTEAWGDGASLPAVPQPGDKWEFHTHVNTRNSGSQTRYYYGRQGSGPGDGYVIELYDDGTFRMEVAEGGSLSPVAESSASLSTSWSAGVWYKIRVWWRHPDKSADHVIQLVDTRDGSVVVEVSGNDQTYSDGDIGVIFNDGPTGGVVDYWRVLDRA